MRQTVTPLLDALWRKQRELGWNDSTLARELGLSQGAVSNLKRGARHGSSRTTQAILTRFPELLGYLLPTEHPPPRRVSA